jgi:small redox-active disulfide protein 2
MTDADVSQVRVGDFAVGIIGLRSVLKEMDGGWAEKPDAQVAAELVERLSRKNYIPESVKAFYGAAFLREFKKFVGKPYQEIPSEGLEIKILGPGCANCDRLEREVMEAVNELGFPAGIDHVRDIREIGMYGVVGSPGLIINGKVKAVGRVPMRSEIKKWLTEAKSLNEGG